MKKSGAPRQSRFARPNTFEIDLAAITRCARLVRDRIGPGIRFFATLKANAYGYGLIPAAHAVISAGADALSMVSLDDSPTCSSDSVIHQSNCQSVSKFRIGRSNRTPISTNSAPNFIIGSKPAI